MTDDPLTDFAHDIFVDFYNVLDRRRNVFQLLQRFSDDDDMTDIRIALAKMVAEAWDKYAATLK